MIDAFLAEMEMEANTTRKFLNELPADKLTYKPHEKSMEAADLAWHIANLPRTMTDWSNGDTFEMNMEKPDHAKKKHTKEEILKEFEESLAHAKEGLAKYDDAKLMGNWTFKVMGKELMTMPRVAMLRSFLANHLYHHRGQFGVYLRLMGAKVPSSYGPSADDNPMEQMMAAAAAKH
jgi:uncharacterized damage-inducible protein DinB